MTKPTTLIRVDNETKNALTKKAEEKGSSVSRVLRELILTRENELDRFFGYKRKK